MKIEIGEIERIRLEPEDRIAVSVPARIDQATGARIENVVAERLGISKDRVLVLGEGMSITVVTP